MSFEDFNGEDFRKTKQHVFFVYVVFFFFGDVSSFMFNKFCDLYRFIVYVWWFRCVIVGIFFWFLVIVVNSLDVHVGVSKNNATPKSSILIGFSIVFTIHFGGFPPIFGLTPMSVPHLCSKSSVVMGI